MTPPPDIVVLASIDWDAVWQRHQVFASLLSRWARVFFVENTGFRSPRLDDLPHVLRRLRRWGGRTQLRNPVPENVRVVSPLVLPPAPGLPRLINAWILLPSLLRRLRAQGLRPHPVLWTYLPTLTTLSAIRALAPSRVVYDCATNFSGHPRAPTYLGAVEQRLLQAADVLLTDSHVLAERYAGRHPRVIELHHGVDIGLFAQADCAPVRRQTLCYFGSLHQHIDWDVIRALARAGFEVALIGSVIGRLPADLPSRVHYHPTVSPPELIGRIAPCAALLLPYHTDTAFMQSVVPAKIYECLATGKPVLASPLPGLSHELRQVLYMCSDPAEFVATASRLDMQAHRPRREQQLALARQHSQEATAQHLRSIFAALLSDGSAPPGAGAA